MTDSTPDSTPAVVDDIVVTQNWAIGKGHNVDDIVSRLRGKVHYPCSRDFVPCDAPCEACEDREEAADEIERLNENLHLIGQLHQGENLADDWLVCIECDYNWPCPTYQLIDSKQPDHG